MEITGIECRKASRRPCSLLPAPGGPTSTIALAPASSFPGPRSGSSLTIIVAGKAPTLAADALKNVRLEILHELVFMVATGLVFC